MTVILRVSGLIPAVVCSGTVIVVTSVILRAGGVACRGHCRATVRALAVPIGAVATLRCTGRAVAASRGCAMRAILVHAGRRMIVFRIASVGTSGRRCTVRGNRSCGAVMWRHALRRIRSAWWTRIVPASLGTRWATSGHSTALDRRHCGRV